LFNVFDPQRRRPRQLGVALLHADVIPVHAGRRLRVGPGALVLAAGWLERLDDLAVLQDIDARQRLRADDLEVELRRLARLELVAHGVFAALDADDDVIRRAVDVPFLHGVEDRLAIVALGQDDAVRDVRGPVITGGLEAEPVTLVEGVVDETSREPTGDVG